MAAEHDPGAALREARARMRGCERCPELVAVRSRVVTGTGGPGAGLLVVSDAPRTAEDVADEPLSGRPRALLDRLLASAGCSPDDVCLTTLVRCLPPAARTPTAAEVASCAKHLEDEVELVGPRVVLALGGLVAGVLRGRPTSIRERRGHAEPCRLGGRAVWLLPAFHPAAALYDPDAVALLAADLALIPELLSRERPELEEEPAPVEAEAAPAVGPGQLDLF